MELMVTTGATRHSKLRSNCHHQQTNTQLFTGGCHSCHPTNSIKALKGKYHHCLLNCNTVRVMSKVCLSSTPDNLSNWVSHSTPIYAFSFLPCVDDALKLFARKEKSGSRSWRTRCEEQNNWRNVDRKWHHVHIIVFVWFPCSRVVKALVYHLVKPRSVPAGTSVSHWRPALNTSRKTSSSCPRFNLASDCARPPVPTS